MENWDDPDLNLYPVCAMCWLHIRLEVFSDVLEHDSGRNSKVEPMERRDILDNFLNGNKYGGDIVCE